MRKEDFFRLLEEYMEGMTVEEKFLEISELRTSDFLYEFEQYLKSKYRWCPNCEKYFEKAQNYERYSEVKTVKDFVYYGGGYNDECRLCDITYRFHYIICPLSFKPIVEKKDYISGLENLRKKKRKGIFKRVSK